MRYLSTVGKQLILIIAVIANAQAKANLDSRPKNLQPQNAKPKVYINRNIACATWFKQQLKSTAADDPQATASVSYKELQAQIDKLDLALKIDLGASLQSLHMATLALQKEDTDNCTAVDIAQAALLDKSDLRLLCFAPFSRIDDNRRLLEKQINYASTAIDNFFLEWFFGDDLALKRESANSRGKFYWHAESIYGGKNSNKTGVDLRLDLPNSQKRAQLIFKSSASDPEQQQLAQTKQPGASAALEIFADGYKQLNPKVTLGMRWHQNRPQIIFQAGIHHLFGSSKHSFTPSYKLDYAQNIGWHNRYQLSYFKKLGPAFGFGSNFVLQDYFQKNWQYYYQDVSLQQRLSARNAILYIFSTYGDNKIAPRFDFQQTAIRWRRRLHSSWLYFELESRYIHSHSLARSPHQSLYLAKFELLFNENS